MNIRPEQPADVAAIRAVNLAAFETGTEANLVEALRAQADPFISLVAEASGSIVGHICCTPVVLGDHPDLKVVGLAPMAVVPAEQRRGIGSQLVRASLDRCRQSGYQAVVVLGHPEYYARFGFVPASHFGIRSEYDVPDEVFMALELESGSLQGKSGTIRYHAAFANV